MASLDDFDRQVKTLVAKGKLSSSLLEGVVDAAMRNMASDAHLVSTLYRCHKKASAANKLTSLYLFDGVAREARSRQKKLDREGKGKGREPAPAPVAGSTTPTGSPPPDSATPATPAESGGTYATFLKKLEALLSKVVLENWENGLPEHKEKVRKVLDIWTKAGTFSSSALVRITQKLLATNTASPAPRQASPERPSLSPPPGSPPRDSTPGTSASAGGPTSIPANVLALLQASSAAPPSQAALEQKRQEDMESEVERVLREAQMGSYNSAPAPAAPKPSTASSASTPISNARPAYPPPPTSTASQQPPPVGPGLSLDPSQLAILQQVAGGLGGSTPIPAPPPQQHASTSLPYQPPPQQQAQPQQYDQPPQAHGRGGDGWASGPLHGGYGPYGGQGGPPSRPPAQPYQQHQPSGYDGPRGQTRSFDESRQQERPGQGGYGGSGGYGGMQQQTQDRRDEPPAKRPYQPTLSMAAAQSGSPPYAQQQGSPPHQQQQQQQYPQQPQQQGGSAPSFSIPPSAPEQSSAASSASTAPPVPPPPFDPTAFDATSPASWASFVAVLRASHPYFIALGRPPTMEEVFQLCAPSAMMALGTGGGMGMGAMSGGGMGQAQQGPDNGDAAGQGGAVGGGESYQGGFGGY
ncbi:hypothetical protein Rhopal_001896-T1 [Rhodotorula paludigena]|uniref:CID domain-containing protein n=1 Tax=Rhodotorula paludigena TaxID=86838 RepID=A0AAV5G8T3_9BASI|nr:hypothetical protein Rhopal_001896-T1 [Rhodotorula paludigena]